MNLSILVSKGLGTFDINDVSDETVIRAIENDIEEFNFEFSRKLNNTQLTGIETDILRTYLWWRTKRYIREFNKELGGMSINHHGEVWLTAADIRISTSSELGRAYDNIILLTARGQTDHDNLVNEWTNWKRTSLVDSKVYYCDSCHSKYRRAGPALIKDIRNPPCPFAP